MTAEPHHTLIDPAAAFGAWPMFGALLLLCVVLFGYVAPRAKAPIFAHLRSHMPHKVLDEYFPSWTPQIADAFLAAIGPEGRAAYRRFYLTLDFWFPGATASLAIASLMLIAFPPSSGWAWLGFVAAVSWLFDLAENITHFRMARDYPNLSIFAVRWGPVFTCAKWISAIAPLTVAVIALSLRYLLR